MTREFTVRTHARSEFVDITREVADVLHSSGATEGVCQVYIPHTTAGVTINENADPDVTHDIITTLDSVIPWQRGYRHGEGNSAAHIKASMMGFSSMIPIRDGRLVLGTWQGIYFCEFDGPRSRRVVVNIIGQ